MNDPVFRRSSRPLPLATVAVHGAALLPSGTDPALVVAAVATLAAAGPGELAFADGDGALEDLRTTRAGACFVAPRHRDAVPATTVALVTDDPRRAFLDVAALIDPETRKPGFWPDASWPEPESRRAIVHADARLESGVSLGPGAVVGPGAEIGAGTTIGANCVIDADVRIGRGCAVGPLVTMSHALIGDGVVVHAGARIGVIEAGGPALGRAIVQNAAEIGANAIVARGVTGDTVIGEGAVVAAATLVDGDTVVPRHATVRGTGR